MDKQLHASISIRIFTDKKCFGPGIATLLHRIDECHSLRAAAFSMEMAYSKAWMILRTCEDALGFKLITSTTGGKNGGGAILTDEGRSVLNAYDEYCAELRKQADRLFEQKFSFYSDLLNAQNKGEGHIK